MSNTFKFVLVAVVGFGLGIAGLYAWNQYSAVKSENMVLKQTSPTPIIQKVTMGETPPPATLPPAASTTPTPSAQPAAEGKITGTLGYPSEGIPPLEVYAFKQADMTDFFKVSTAQNQSSFAIPVEAGTYVVVAYTKDGGGAGGYTKMVPCGLLASCTDHSLIPVVVPPNGAALGVEVKDWYAPEGTFPKKPN